MRRPPLFLALFAGTLLLLGTGCSPSISPLYRDYEVQPSEPALEERVASALTDAGWSLEEESVGGALRTEPQTFGNWGLYKLRVLLEVTPLGADHVRVFIHPYRTYVTGGRSKIPYLPKSLRKNLVTRLNEAFEEQGLAVVGTPIERDREEQDPEKDPAAKSEETSGT